MPNLAFANSLRNKLALNFWISLLRLGYVILVFFGIYLGGIKISEIPPVFSFIPITIKSEILATDKNNVPTNKILKEFPADKNSTPKSNSINHLRDTIRGIAKYDPVHKNRKIKGDGHVNKRQAGGILDAADDLLSILPYYAESITRFRYRKLNK